MNILKYIESCDTNLDPLILFFTQSLFSIQEIEKGLPLSSFPVFFYVCLPFMVANLVINYVEKIFSQSPLLYGVAPFIIHPLNACTAHYCIYNIVLRKKKHGK